MKNHLLRLCLACLALLAAAVGARAQAFELTDDIRELQRKHLALKGKERYESALQIGLTIEKLEENRKQLGLSGLVAPYYEEALQLARQLRQPGWASEVLTSLHRYAVHCNEPPFIERQVQRLDSLYRKHPQPDIRFAWVKASAELARIREDSITFEQKAREAIAVAQNARLHPHEVDARLYWAHYLQQKRRFHESLQQVKAVLALHEAHNEFKDLNQRYEQLSDLYDRMGHSDSANLMMSRYFESALKVNDPGHIAGVTLRIGNHYAGSGRFRKAVPYFLISQRILDSLRVVHQQEGSSRFMQDGIDVAVVRGNLAGCYVELGLLDSSIYWIHKAHHIARAVQFTDADIYFHFQLANIYYELNKPDSALAHADASVQVLSPFQPGMELAYLVSLTLRGHLRNLYWGGDLGAADLLQAYRYFRGFRQRVPDARHGQSYYRRNYFRMLAEGLHALGYIEPALQVLGYYSLILDNFRAEIDTERKSDLIIAYELKARDRKIEVLELQHKLAAQHQNRQYLYLGAGGIALAVSLLFVWVWVRRNHERKLQNRRLSQENQRVEQQNAELESASQELRAAVDQLQEQQRLLTLRQNQLDQSLHYAYQIQSQLLGDRLQLTELAGEHLLFYVPRDVVSGDFYWWHPADRQLHLAVIDCTGHGVPGALMSVMAFHLLEDWIENHAESSPAECLIFLDHSIRRALKQERAETALDGMDLAYFQIDWATGKLRFAGARRPLWLRREGQWHCVEGARRSIGGRDDPTTTFETRSLLLHPGDRLFAFTDGVTDQFGGPRRRKLGTEALLAELASYDGLSLAEAEAGFAAFFRAWRGSHARLDDVLLLGLEFRERKFQAVAANLKHVYV